MFSLPWNSGSGDLEVIVTSFVLVALGLLACEQAPKWSWS